MRDKEKGRKGVMEDRRREKRRRGREEEKIREGKD